MGKTDMKNIDMETLKAIISTLGTSTNPTEYYGHEKFIEYMDDKNIMSFGSWMQANGFNVAFTTLIVELRQKGFDI